MDNTPPKRSFSQTDIDRAIAKDRIDRARQDKEAATDQALKAVLERLERTVTLDAFERWKTDWKQEWMLIASHLITRDQLDKDDFWLRMPETLVESLAEKAARIVREEAEKAAAGLLKKAAATQLELKKEHKAFQDTLWGRVAIGVAAFGVFAQYLQAFHVVGGKT